MQHNSQPTENQRITKQHVFNLLNPVIRGIYTSPLTVSLILLTAPRAATAARGDREVAKPPSGNRGSRRLPKGKEQRR